MLRRVCRYIFETVEREVAAAAVGSRWGTAADGRRMSASCDLDGEIFRVGLDCILEREDLGLLSSSC